MLTLCVCVCVCVCVCARVHPSFSAVSHAIKRRSLAASSATPPTSCCWSSEPSEHAKRKCHSPRRFQSALSGSELGRATQQTKLHLTFHRFTKCYHKSVLQSSVLKSSAGLEVKRFVHWSSTLRFPASMVDTAKMTRSIIRRCIWGTRRARWLRCPH